MTEDASLWRLRTPERQVPYKILGMEGDILNQEAHATLRAVIQASRLQDFVLELMPDPIRVGRLVYWKNETLPGFPSMAVDKVRFKAAVDGRPIDPFGYDTNAADGTYEPLLELYVDYSTYRNPKKRTPDPTKPETFLEISASASYEMLNVYAGKSKWIIESNPLIDAGGDPEDGEDGTWINPSTGELYGTYTDPDTGEIIRGPITTPAAEEDQKKTNKTGGSVPITIIVPLVNWSVRWPDVEHDFFENTLIKRLRAASGKVNRETVEFLYGLEPETLLFANWSYNEKNSWRELTGASDSPPIDVTMNFIERRIIWKGLIKGWNDYWSNDEGGWTKMTFNGTDKPYQKWNHQLLFKVD